jgi:hypothetical protein
MWRCPRGIAVSGLMALREDLHRAFFQFLRNPRLPVNRGFFIGPVCQERRTKEKQSKNMNKPQERITTRFGPETRFEVKPALPATPFRVARENRFEELKKRLVAQKLDDLWEEEGIAHVRRAANEATALAWTTEHPLLFFPGLFEEKIQSACQVASRQGEVRARTRELVSL